MLQSKNANSILAKLKMLYFSHQILSSTPQQYGHVNSLYQNLSSTDSHVTSWMACLFNIMLITHLRPTLVSPAKHEWRRSCRHTEWDHAHKQTIFLSM